MVIKVNNCYGDSKEVMRYERDTCVHVAKFNPWHNGHMFVRTIHNSFEIKGLHGTHMCLVFLPMKENLKQYQQRFEGQRLPSHLLKLYLEHILQGLDYLHSECHIIHTGELRPTLIIQMF